MGQTAIGNVFAGFRRKAADLRHSEAGVSAVEFALVAPVFAIALVLMVDVGLAFYQRMGIDHVLRSGAQAAMADPGVGEVLKVLQSTQGLNPEPGQASVAFAQPARFCACPESADVDPAAAPACTVSCAGGAAPYVYYRMSASATYDGMLIPEIPLGSSLQVQVR